jgi:hypothetical protein
LPRKVAIITSAANQISVSQALLAARMSSQLSTVVISSSDRPTRAVVVGSRPNAGPSSQAGMPAQTASISTRTPSVMISGTFIGPSFSSSALASAFAPGVCLISGG